jgi:hypothetical protein
MDVQALAAAIGIGVPTTPPAKPTPPPAPKPTPVARPAPVAKPAPPAPKAAAPAFVLREDKAKAVFSTSGSGSRRRPSRRRSRHLKAT